MGAPGRPAGADPRRPRLELEDADAVVARLGRLTQGQREAVAEAMERILEMGA
jgi:hypothetical protein